MTINILDNNEPTPDQNDKTSEFEAMVDSMPETAQGFLDAALPPSNSVEDVTIAEGDGFIDASSGEPVAASRKRVNVTKKVQRAMKRLKTKVANVPIMWFHVQAKNNPEWELDEEEQGLIKDAIDTVFDVLDIEIEIEPLSWTLTSVWWAISYPILAFVLLFLTKKSQTMESAQHPDQLE